MVTVACRFPGSAGAALAIRADTAHLDGVFVCLETFRDSGALNCPANGGVVQFCDRAAAAAQQKLAGAWMSGLAAADKRIQRGQPVYQPLLGEKVQRPINGGRCGRAAFVSEHYEYGIGTEWPVAAPDYFQHAGAQDREPGATCVADLRCLRHGIGDAKFVIVRVPGEPLLWIGRQVSPADSAVAFLSRAQA